MITLVRRPLRVTALALALASFALAPLAAGAAGPAVGEPAPPFALTTLDGRAVSLASFRGKTLVINVWGSWCPPCRLEMPDLVAEAAADRGDVAFLGVDTTETPAVARAFTAAKGVGYPQVVTTAASPFARAYDIRNYPTTIVIDPQGIVRARHADNILPRAQLHAYVAAARAGRSAPLVSAEQTKLDASLDPARYPFTGTPSSILVAVRAADRAIAAVDDEMDDAMTDPARDHDLIKTLGEERTLRDAAIAALGPLADDTATKTLLARLEGDQYDALGRWDDADASYARALAFDPNDRAALGGQAYAASKRGDLARVAELDARIAALAPAYDTRIALVRADAALGRRDAAYVALDGAIAAARATGNPAELAWTHLYGGRSAIVLGDRARARSEFRAAELAAETIPPRDPHFTMYLEQAQEAAIALDLGAANGATGLSLAPWTGRDLPGSIASTLKYRLAISGAAGRRVELVARGLPAGWIGSFCSDRLCSPFRSSVVLPANGIKIVEFQVVPGDRPARRPTVAISALDGVRVVAAVHVRVAATP